MPFSCAFASKICPCLLRCGRCHCSGLLHSPLLPSTTVKNVPSRRPLPRCLILRFRLVSTSPPDAAPRYGALVHPSDIFRTISLIVSYAEYSALVDCCAAWFIAVSAERSSLVTLCAITSNAPPAYRKTRFSPAAIIAGSPHSAVASASVPPSPSLNASPRLIVKTTQSERCRTRNDSAARQEKLLALPAN